MSNFFPVGLKLDDTKSPMEILHDAQQDWETESGGLLTLVMQNAKSKSGNDMIIVHAKHIPSNRTISLFSVVSRPGHPFPLTIQPKEDELPKFLRKSYKEEIRFNALQYIQEFQSRTIENEWVADTSTEFRNKLIEVFNLGTIKSEVLNLVCGTPDASGDPDLSKSQDEKE